LRSWPLIVCRIVFGADGLLVPLNPTSFFVSVFIAAVLLFVLGQFYFYFVKD
jgi:Sec-independent protein secretion pathway component TatC